MATLKEQMDEMRQLVADQQAALQLLMDNASRPSEAGETPDVEAQLAEFKDHFSGVVEAQQETIDDLRNQLKGSAVLAEPSKVEEEASVAKRVREMLKAQRPHGKYKYRVIHHGHESGLKGNDDAKRVWASHRYMPPFECELDDPKQARQLYFKLTGCRPEDRNAVELVSIESGTESE